MTDEIGIDMIKNESDAASFYYSVVVENGVVFDADRGFFKANGKPAIPNIPVENLYELQDCHNKAMRILRDEANVDAQEVINYFESLLVKGIVDGEKPMPAGMNARVIPKIREESYQQRQQRRWSHLWDMLIDTLKHCVEGFVYDESSMGLAIPNDVHPVIQAYLENCVDRLPIEQSVDAIAKEDANEENIKDMIRGAKGGKKFAKDDIDPDSDENDDDPFSSGMWA